MADDIGIQQEMLIEPTHKKLEIVDGHAVKDVEDYQNPELLYKSLIERVRKYHPSADVSMIEKAYHIARDAHKGQTRKSGEEYIIHPLWVGIILAQLEMDKETIVAGILHDVVEDTVMTDEEIRQEFGDEVALLVDGVTKLGQLSYSADKLEVRLRIFVRCSLRWQKISVLSSSSLPTVCTICVPCSICDRRSSWKKQKKPWISMLRSHNGLVFPRSRQSLMIWHSNIPSRRFLTIW